MRRTDRLRVRIDRIRMLLPAFLLLAAACGGPTILEDAVETCSILDALAGIEVADEGASLLIDGKGEEDITGAPISDIACVLQVLEVPDAVIARIDSTSALMGQQEAEWSGLIARWTYHPNRGLDIIIELSDG